MNKTFFIIGYRGLINKLAVIATVLILVVTIFSPTVLTQDPNLSDVIFSGKSTVEIDVENTGDITRVDYVLSGFQIENIFIDNKEYMRIFLDNESNILKKGFPNLPNICRSIIIPDDKQMSVKVIYGDFEEFENVLVSPSKGSLSRSINPNDVPYIFDDFYNSDQWFPNNLTYLGEPYIVRDYRGQVVKVNPVQYNPALQKIRFYTNISIEVYPVGQGEINVLHRYKSTEKIDRDYRLIYENHFINFQDSKYTPVDETGNMLIICYDDFYANIRPLAEWKNMKGIHTELVNFSDIGSAASEIKDYIVSYYNTYGLTFVLLAGDIEQIPSLTASGYTSDPSYGYIAGDDSYPEIFVGRFSAQDIFELETQVDRTLTYEKYPQSGAEWYHKGTGIGSPEGTGDDNEYDYEHIRNIRTDLLGFTYTSVDELYGESQGGEDEPGCPPPSLTTSKLNEGRSILNYCGHGSSTSWGWNYPSHTAYTNSDIATLENDYMLPFIISVACSNGVFASMDECFCEAWMRATNDLNGNPTGAIVITGSSKSMDWDPPMAAQDEMIDLLTEQYADKIMRTVGGIHANGCMLMNDEYSYSGPIETNCWHIFGDPSLQLRTDTPININVQHDSTILSGSKTFEMTTDVTDALCALSYNGVLLGSAYTGSGGAATIQCAEPIDDIDMVDLVVTAFNTIPYITTVYVTPPTRQPAEFEPIEGVLINYGAEDSFGIPYSIIAELSEDIEVVTIVDSQSQQNTVNSFYQSNGVNTAHCSYLIAPSDSYWTRDYGPWFRFNGTTNQLEVINFTYNRIPSPYYRLDDDKIPEAFAVDRSYTLAFLDIMHTGGNYMTDGQGIAVSTDLFETENPGLSTEDIEVFMMDVLGIETYHIVPDVLGEYIKHIDCWAKYLSPETIMIIEVPTDHTQYNEIEAAVDYFESQKSCYGDPYEIVRVYTPNDEPYVNSLIANNKVFVPQTGTSSWDDDALATYQAAMPGYEIFGITSLPSDPWLSTDAIHCRIKGIPDDEMLYIDHIPLTFQNPNPEGFLIKAMIYPYSEMNLVSGSPDVLWRTEGGAWNSIDMSALENNWYEASIPSQPLGSTIEYYISAEDESGRIEHHSYIGEADPHSFYVTNIPAVTIDPESYDFGAIYGGESLQTIFEIWNSGTGDLTYSISSEHDFITISPDVGMSSGEHDTITVYVDTSGILTGEYEWDIDISSNGGTTIFTVSVDILFGGTYILDQEQLQGGYGFMTFGDRWAAQSFVPSEDSLSRVDLFLSKRGSPSNDLTVLIRDELNGADLASAIIPGEDITDTAEWIMAPFSEIAITPGETHYIIIRTNGGSAGSCYLWQFGYSTPYTAGVFQFSSNAGGSWTSYTTYDFCFKTYGSEEEPPEPVLSYNPTSHDFGSMLAGETDDTSFDIWNSGGGILTYSLSESCSWVTLGFYDGTSTGEHDTITVDVDTSGLSVDDYTCDISITSDGGYGTFTVTLAVVDPVPVLAYNPTSFDFGNMLLDEMDSTTFDVWNSGEGTLTYTLSESCDWVSLSDSGGSSSGEHDTITVSVDTDGLPMDDYSCDISITSDGGSGTFTVSLSVVEPIPLLSYTPTSFDFGDMFVDETDSTSFEIWNGGTGTLSYSLSESCGWVTIGSYDGTSTGEHDSITVTVNTNGLPVDDYSCDISINSDGGSETFTVTLSVVDPVPVLAYSPISFDFGSILPDETDSITFDVWNSGEGTLTYSLSESCGWVTIGSYDGTSTGEHDTITITVDTTGLSNGDYDCDIGITSDGGSGSFTVELSVVSGGVVLDQEQTQSGYGFMMFGSRWAAQSFVPSMSTLSQVDVLMAKRGGFTGDLTVSVRSSLSGADLTSAVVPAGSVGDVAGWVEVDLPDISVTAGETYYIVMHTVGGSSSSCYLWSFGYGTSYTSGVFSFTSNAGSSWLEYGLYDFCFKTYGQN